MLGPVIRPSLLAAGAGTLVLGVAFYAVARPDTVLLMPAWLHAGTQTPILPAAVTGWLPTLVHVLGFSLLTLSFLELRAAGIAAVCAGWALVNVLFEIGQHPMIAAWILAQMAQVPGLGWVTPYFANGTFSPTDLAAAPAGALVAVAVARVLQTRGDHP